MNRWSSLFKPKTLRVQPSLRGLRVVDDTPGDDEPARTLYEWEAVVQRGESSSLGPHYWQLADQSQRSGPHRVLRISDPYEQRIAHRAQLRWYRRALETGDLQITEDYGSGWPLVLAAIGPLTFVTVPVFFLVRLASGWDVADRLPAGTWVLAWAVLAAFLLMTVLFAAPLLLLVARMILSQRVSRAEVSADGICTALSTGREVSYPWTDLVSLLILGTCAQARFRDCRSLWFPLRQHKSRTVTVLRVCRDRFLPEEAARRRRAERRSYVRIAVWCFLGSTLAGLLTALYGIDDRSRLSGLALAGLMFLASGILVVFLSWGDRFSRWDHRRARRAARRRRRQRSRNVA